MVFASIYDAIEKQFRKQSICDILLNASFNFYTEYIDDEHAESSA